MPGNSRRAAKVVAAFTAVQTTAVLLATHAVATPSPTPSPSGSTSADQECKLLVGEAKNICENGKAGSNSGTTPSVTNTTDPLSSLGKGCAEAASWTIDKLSEAVKETANVDFTNPRFLQQYAVVFAASTILTLLLWLLAVAKRAVRGVPLTTAISEAIGFLWLTVIASAFTP